MITTTSSQRRRQRDSFTGMNGYVPRSRTVHAVAWRRAGGGLVAGKLCRPWDHKYLESMRPTSRTPTCPMCVHLLATGDEVPRSWSHGPLPTAEPTLF